MIAAEPVTDVDTTASDVLEELDSSLNAQGIALVFAEMKDPVRHRRTVRDYERLLAHHETYVSWAVIIVMVRCLAGEPSPASAEPSRRPH